MTQLYHGGFAGLRLARNRRSPAPMTGPVRIGMPTTDALPVLG
jgi:hypothetical protein